MLPAFDEPFVDELPDTRKFDVEDVLPVEPLLTEDELPLCTVELPFAEEPL